MIEHIWAIDPALSRLAFAFAPLDGGEIVIETLRTATDAEEGERLGLLDRQTRIYAQQRANEFPPAAVIVEQPSGRFRALQLTYAVGVVQAALFEALGVPTWTLPSSAWKRATVGVGNATKQQVAAWVAARGATVASQDEADAFALAAAGRAMLVERRWGAAA